MKYSDIIVFIMIVVCLVVWYRRARHDAAIKWATMTDDERLASMIRANEWWHGLWFMRVIAFIKKWCY